MNLGSARAAAGRTHWLLILGAVLAAALLRFPHLADRPMHADEAILADKLGTLLEKGEYHYDPAGYHGPALLYLSWIPVRLAGVRSYAGLTENLLRLTPALCGILLVLTPLLLIPAIGRRAALWAAVLLAVSPAFVYYSRYFIPEMPLVLFTAAFVAAGWSWLVSGKTRWALAAGASVGLMVATKETAVLAIAPSALALAPFVRPKWRARSAQGAAALAAAVLVASSCLSSFGKNPAGIWDYVRSYFSTYLGRGLESGPHTHPWGYYFGQLLWFRQGGGPPFTEGAIYVLAALGAWAAWVSGMALPRFLVLYAVALAAIYSLIPYKTPWCALSFHMAFILLAGYGANRLLDSAWGRLRALLWALLLTGAGCLAWQSYLAAGRFAADPRNPWVYAHTTPDVFEIRDRLESVAAVHESGRAMQLQVFSRVTPWPLPWYLRSWTRVEWWNGIPSRVDPAPAVLAAAELEPQVAALLYESRPPGLRELYMRLFDRPLFLRPGVEFRGYVRKGLWDRLHAPSASR